VAAPAGPEVLLSGLSGPDDLAWDRDGNLLISDINAGTVSRYSLQTGRQQTLASGLRAPEGMVGRADGSILVAEQALNRIVRLDPDTHAVTPWRSFPNRTGRPGIDGIAQVSRSGDVIVPDSPNQVVFRVSPDGATATRIGGGMVRPVGAGIDKQGRIYVADEAASGAVWILSSNPSEQRRIAGFAFPDDVVIDPDGNALVNTLGVNDNAIHQIAPDGKQSVVLKGLKNPQGIEVDGAGNIYFTEFDTGKVERLVRTFVLGTPTAVAKTSGTGATARTTYVICPTVRRSGGFTAPIELSLKEDGTVERVAILQPTSTTSGTVEVRIKGGSAAVGQTATIVLTSGNYELTQEVSLP
jgi:serine/threonine-protein kinase